MHSWGKYEGHISLKYGNKHKFCFIPGEEVTLELVQLSPCSKESQTSSNTDSVASALNAVTSQSAY